LFFESFPLVFGNIYGFNLGEQGLAFLGTLSIELILPIPVLKMLLVIYRLPGNRFLHLYWLCPLLAIPYSTFVRLGTHDPRG
jgi:hypothetical protein